MVNNIGGGVVDLFDPSSEKFGIGSQRLPLARMRSHRSL
jgi:hypothetical protein